MVLFVSGKRNWPRSSNIAVCHGVQSVRAYSTYCGLCYGLVKERGGCWTLDHMQRELNPGHTFTFGFFKFLFNIILPKSKGLRSSPYSLVYLFLLLLTLRNTFPLFCCRSVATFTQTDATQTSRCLATRCHCAVAACVALPAKTICNKIDVMWTRYFYYHHNSTCRSGNVWNTKFFTFCC